MFNLNAAGHKGKPNDVRNDPHSSMVDDDFVDDSLIRIADKGSKRAQVMQKDCRANQTKSSESRKRTRHVVLVCTTFDDSFYIILSVKSFFLIIIM